MSDHIEPDMMHAVGCEGVVKGICVMMEDGYVVYAGPIGGVVGKASGKLVLMNAEDMRRLREFVEKHRH